MATQTSLILVSGGLRSLVALALAAADMTQPNQSRRAVLLHIRDSQENAAQRHDAFRRQSQHYQMREVIELELPHLQAQRMDQLKQGKPASPLRRAQVLLTAMAQAVEWGASMVIWPVQFNADFDAVARVTESVVLARHLAQLDAAHWPPEAVLPSVQTPLLDLSDRQLIETGAQLDAPWHLAWTCERGTSAPCRVCIACRRRRSAFESAGISEEPRRPTIGSRGV